MAGRSWNGILFFKFVGALGLGQGIILSLLAKKVPAFDDTGSS